MWDKLKEVERAREGFSFESPIYPGVEQASAFNFRSRKKERGREKNVYSHLLAHSAEGCSGSKPRAAISVRVALEEPNYLSHHCCCTKACVIRKLESGAWTRHETWEMWMS